MALYSTTALGRMVPYGRWGDVHRDLVLKILYDYGMSPFNVAHDFLGLLPLANACGLAPNQTQFASDALVTEGLVERPPAAAGAEPRYRITGPGAQYVQNLGAQAALP